MTTLKCPTCERSFESEGVKSLPFCSPRCQKIDLGRWLRESYAFPATRLPDELEDELPPGFERERTTDPYDS